MEKEELQIGNWFQVSKEGCGIDKFQVWGMDCEGLVIVNADEDWVLAKDITPIPITEEFLENNGFKKFFDDICEFDYYTKEIDGNYIDIKMDCSNTSEENVVCHVDNCDRCTIGSADIRYVHQLQNFLTVLNIKMEVK